MRIIKQVFTISLVMMLVFSGHMSIVHAEENDVDEILQAHSLDIVSLNAYLEQVMPTDTIDISTYYNGNAPEALVVTIENGEAEVDGAMVTITGIGRIDITVSHPGDMIEVPGVDENGDAVTEEGEPVNEWVSAENGFEHRIGFIVNPSTKIVFDQTNVLLEVGETIYLCVKAGPEGTAKESIGSLWLDYDTNVSIVEATFASTNEYPQVLGNNDVTYVKIIAKKAGNTAITITDKEDMTSTVTITVVDVKGGTVKPESDIQEVVERGASNNSATKVVAPATGDTTGALLYVSNCACALIGLGALRKKMKKQ